MPVQAELTYPFTVTFNDWEPQTFDAATITTTHGFCQEVVASLGVAGDAELDTVFVEDVSDLLGEVVDDLYVRRFAGGGDPPRISRAEALKIATLAVDNPAAPIQPVESEDQTTAAMRGRLARAVRRELDRRMRLGALMSYDDLLMRLDATLHGTSGDEVVATLRRRFKIVLVDEFQDTDPVQWSIVHRAFGGGDGTLVLIGDPKQAIYSFRGADVYAYLAAAEAAGTRATLQTNWRSDQGLLDAYDALFGRARLGHPGIVYRQVQAAAGNRAPRLTGAPVPAPLRVRILARERAGLTTKGYAQARGAREAIACDLANDLVRLLSSGATVAEEGGEAVAVCPGHVAVLVRTNRQAALVRDALEDVGVPAVINGAGSVFGTEPAREWLRLLEALERPASPTRAASVALTAFLGWTPAQVAAATEDDWEAVHQRLPVDDDIHQTLTRVDHANRRRPTPAARARRAGIRHTRPTRRRRNGRGHPHSRISHHRRTIHPGPKWCQTKRDQTDPNGVKNKRGQTPFKKWSLTPFAVFRVRTSGLLLQFFQVIPLNHR